MVTTQINGTGGLCVTCNNAPTCFHRARRGPALFCELFDNYAPPVERPGVADTMSFTRPSVLLDAPTQQEEPKYTGLCVNCEHRKTCAHPRPTGGVWHCEDYA
jgi:hypothetical protein